VLKPNEITPNLYANLPAEQALLGYLILHPNAVVQVGDCAEGM